MEKYYNEQGQVGVIISPDFGAGWSTWNGDSEELLFDKQLVEAVLEKNFDKILQRAEELYPNGYFSEKNLVVEFLDEGTMFRIDDYDGAERIVIYSPDDYYVA